MESILVVAIVVLLGVLDYRKSPSCQWCQSRHFGRCVFNPRAGRFFANTNDGHFDYNNPNR